MKNTFSFQFIFIVLIILVAFFVYHWTEQAHEEKYSAAMMNNLIAHVRQDSTNIAEAVDALKVQHDSLSALSRDLDGLNFKKANSNIHYTYFLYNFFAPTRESLEARILGREMEIWADNAKLGEIKDLDRINNKLRDLHQQYAMEVTLFRNSFIFQHNLTYFDFEAMPKERGNEFWNRLNILAAAVETYYGALVLAQEKYNAFLKDFKRIEH
jgi:hypothetical protein